MHSALGSRHGRRRRATAALVAAALVAALAPAALAADGPPGTIYSIVEDQPGERFGWAASDFADVDRDGAHEFLVSDPAHANASGPRAGHTDLRSGRTGALLRRFEGQAQEAHGFAIADAGDVDGDRVHDVLAGAPQALTVACGPANGPGHAYVYSGRTGALLLTLTGEAVGDQFGYAVAGAGDVDRDGRADVVVGAPCNDARGADGGRVYVHSGRDGHLIRIVEAEAAGDMFGAGAGPAGDVDRDGVADHAVGAPDAGDGDRGVAYVLSGGNGRRILRLAGDDTNVDFGLFFVAGVGDVSGDRRPDVYVADFSAGPGGNGEGRAYVFSGRTGRALHTFVGDQPGDGLGPGRSAGDVDRDGRNDLAIGSYLSSEGAPQAGKVEVFSGKTGRPLRTYVSVNAGETLGFDAIGIGDVNRDHRADLVLTGAIGNAVYVVSS